MFDLFETLVTQRDPLWGISKRIGLNDVLSVDEGFAHEEFMRTQKDRHVGRIKSREEAFNLIARRNGLTIDKKLLQALQQQLCEQKAETFGKIDSDVVEMLRFLREMQIKTCVVTNCELFEIEHYRRSELPALVGQAVFSCEIGIAKPDRGIYLTALEATGVEAGQSLFVGDGGSNELYGAEGVGIAAYQACWFLDQFDEEFRRDRLQPFIHLHNPMNVVEIARGDLTFSKQPGDAPD